MNKKRIYPQWFLILPLALYIIFFLLPSVMGVGYSFTDWNSRSVLNGTHFVGLQNFAEIFTSDKSYLSGIGNTLKFTIISNIVKLIPALLIAIMLQEGLKGKGLYRTLLYLPSILPFVIIGLVFKSILNYNNGLLNTLLDAFHLGIFKQKWLSDLAIVWKSIYGVDAWRGIGYVMTIFLAGLNTIPKSYYEAAQIDGANRWQQTWHVTLPGMKMIIVLMMVLSLGNVLNAGFDQIFNMYSTSVYQTGDIIDTFVYRLGLLDAQYGPATAVGLFKSVISTLFISISYFLAYKLADYRIF